MRLVRSLLGILFLCSIRVLSEDNSTRENVGFTDEGNLQIRGESPIIRNPKRIRAAMRGIRTGQELKVKIQPHRRAIAEPKQQKLPHPNPTVVEQEKRVKYYFVLFDRTKLSREAQFYLTDYKVARNGNMTAFFLPGPLADWSRNKDKSVNPEKASEKYPPIPLDKVPQIPAEIMKYIGAGNLPDAKSVHRRFPTVAEKKPSQHTASSIAVPVTTVQEQEQRGSGHRPTSPTTPNKNAEIESQILNDILDSLRAPQMSRKEEKQSHPLKKTADTESELIKTHSKKFGSDSRNHVIVRAETMEQHLFKSMTVDHRESNTQQGVGQRGRHGASRTLNAPPMGQRQEKLVFKVTDFERTDTMKDAEASGTNVKYEFAKVEKVPLEEYNRLLALGLAPPPPPADTELTRSANSGAGTSHTQGSVQPKPQVSLGGNSLSRHRRDEPPVAPVAPNTESPPTAPPVFTTRAPLTTRKDRLTETIDRTVDNTEDYVEEEQLLAKTSTTSTSTRSTTTVAPQTTKETTATSTTMRMNTVEEVKQQEVIPVSNRFQMSSGGEEHSINTAAVTRATSQPTSDAEKRIERNILISRPTRKIPVKMEDVRHSTFMGFASGPRSHSLGVNRGVEFGSGPSGTDLKAKAQMEGTSLKDEKRLAEIREEIAILDGSKRDEGSGGDVLDLVTDVSTARVIETSHAPIIKTSTVTVTPDLLRKQEQLQNFMKMPLMKKEKKIETAVFSTKSTQAVTSPTTTPPSPPTETTIVSTSTAAVTEPTTTTTTTQTAQATTTVSTTSRVASTSTTTPSPPAFDGSEDYPDSIPPMAQDQKSALSQEPTVSVSASKQQGHPESDQEAVVETPVVKEESRLLSEQETMAFDLTKGIPNDQSSRVSGANIEPSSNQKETVHEEDVTSLRIEEAIAALQQKQDQMESIMKIQLMKKSSKFSVSPEVQSSIVSTPEVTDIPKPQSEEPSVLKETIIAAPRTESSPVETSTATAESKPEKTIVVKTTVSPPIQAVIPVEQVRLVEATEKIAEDNRPKKYETIQESEEERTEVVKKNIKKHRVKADSSEEDSDESSHKKKHIKHRKRAHKKSRSSSEDNSSQKYSSSESESSSKDSSEDKSSRFKHKYVGEIEKMSSSEEVSREFYSRLPIQVLPRKRASQGTSDSSSEESGEKKAIVVPMAKPVPTSTTTTTTPPAEEKRKSRHHHHPHHNKHKTEEREKHKSHHHKRHHKHRHYSSEEKSSEEQPMFVTTPSTAAPTTTEITTTPSTTTEPTSTTTETTVVTETTTPAAETSVPITESVAQPASVPVSVPVVASMDVGGESAAVVHVPMASAPVMSFPSVPTPIIETPPTPDTEVPRLLSLVGTLNAQGLVEQHNQMQGAETDQSLQTLEEQVLSQRRRGRRRRKHLRGARTQMGQRGQALLQSVPTDQTGLSMNNTLPLPTSNDDEKLHVIRRTVKEIIPLPSTQILEGTPANLEADERNSAGFVVQNVLNGNPNMAGGSPVFVHNMKESHLENNQYLSQQHQAPLPLPLGSPPVLEQPEIPNAFGPPLAQLPNMHMLSARSYAPYTHGVGWSRRSYWYQH